MAPQDFSTAGRDAEICFRAGGIDLHFFLFFWSIFIFIGLFENPAPTLETSVAGGIAFKYCVQEEAKGRGTESKHKTKAGEKNKKKSKHALPSVCSICLEGKIQV